MPIVSSAVVDFAPQIDGRIFVREQHLDSFGVNHSQSYLATEGTTLAQANVACAAKDAAITAQMTANEIQTNINQVSTFGKFATITLNESTGAQNITVFRAQYALMTQLQSVFTGEYLSTLSDASLELTFSMTQPQVATLRANFLTPQAAEAASIRASVGT